MLELSMDVLVTLGALDCSAASFHSVRHAPGLYTGWGGDFESLGGTLSTRGTEDKGMLPEAVRIVWVVPMGELAMSSNFILSLGTSSVLTVSEFVVFNLGSTVLELPS